MSDVALRIYYWDGTTHAHGSYFDFTDTLSSYVDLKTEEVMLFRVSPNFQTTLVESCLTKPKLFSQRPATWSGISSVNLGHDFDLQVNVAHYNTRLKMDTLLANYYIWKIHYTYDPTGAQDRDPNVYFMAVIDPNYVLERFGPEMAKQVMAIKGYESTNKNFYHSYVNTTAPTHVLARGYKQSPYMKVYLGDPPEAMTSTLELINTNLKVDIAGIDSFMEVEPDKMSSLTFPDLSLNCLDYPRILNKFNQRTQTDTEYRNTYALIDVWGDTYAILKQQGRFKHNASAYDYPWQNGRKFKVGDVINVASGTTLSENITVTAEETVTVDTNYKSQKIYFDDPGVDFAEDSVVFMGTMIGKYMSVYLKLVEDLTYEQIIYKGFVKKPYNISDNKTQITLEHFLAKYFRQNPRIIGGAYDPTMRVSKAGAWETSVKWNDGSTGTLDNITVFPGAIPGHWKITFSDATNFTVTGPNCEEKAGTTNNPFYDQTDASDSQIFMSAANSDDWSIETRVTITAGDVDFRAGLAVYFDANDAIQWGFCDVADELHAHDIAASATEFIKIHPYCGGTTPAVDLKITKDGTTYTFYYKRTTATKWTTAGTKVKAGSPTKTCLFVQSWTAAEHIVYFDYFRSSQSDLITDEEFASGIDAGYTQYTPNAGATFAASGGQLCITVPGTDTYDWDDDTDEAPQLQNDITAGDSWGGTPAKDDVVEFDVAINFDTMTVAEIVYSILSDYLGLPDSVIDVTTGGPGAATTKSFDVLHTTFTSDFKMSFNKDTSALEKIISVLPHAASFIGSRMDGIITVFSFHDNFYTINSPFGANIEKINLLEQLDIFNEITVQYAWDPDASYQYSYTYPLDNNINESYNVFRKKRSVEIQCPFIFTDTEAEKIAKRFYAVNKFGMTKIQATGFLDSIEVDVGDVVNVNDYYIDSITPNYEDGNIQAVVVKKQLQLGQKNRIVFDMILFPYGELGDFA